MTTASPEAARTRPRATSQPTTRRPPLWNVVLLDSDDHTYEFVIEMLGSVFGHPTERAFKLARTVDESGRAVIKTTHRELAELKAEQVRGFGLDPRVATCAVPMRAILEPASAGGDEHNA